MFHDDEVPLHSAKHIVRRLRAANDRLSRNNFLSTVFFYESTDAQ